MYMKVVAKALLQDSEGRYLLLYRGMTHPNFPGHLDLPGGEIEKGEEWIDAVAREVGEETSIEITPSQLSLSFEKQHDNVIHVLFTGYLEQSSLEIKLSWEHTSFDWLSRDDLLNQPLPDGVDRYYADVIEYLRRLT